jgi:G6PDH family F420-dependent oxidoreductase
MPRRQLRLGYALSSEEHEPRSLVRNAALAEKAGFSHALISDHFHPWSDAQGHSPFVWSVLGGIAGATTDLEVGTGVTCPIARIHPAIVAHAAATTAAMMPRRFSLGVGTGELLNEHVLGQPWPVLSTRLEMLEEAVGVIRDLWGGDLVTHHGPHFTVENARLYTLPKPLPRILMASGGPESAALAGRIADGLIATAPDAELVRAFRAGRRTKESRQRPCYGQLTVCWARTEPEARRTAHRLWANAGIPGQASQELPLPAQFEELAGLVTEEAIAEQVVCGPDPDRHLEAIDAFARAGFDHVYIHQVGPDQAGFIDYYADEILPRYDAPSSTLRRAS